MLLNSRPLHPTCLRVRPCTSSSLPSRLALHDVRYLSSKYRAFSQDAFTPSTARISARSVARCARVVAALSAGSADTNATGADGNVSLTQRIMESLPLDEEAGGAGGRVSYSDLQRADAAWLQMRSAPPGPPALPPPKVVKRVAGKAADALAAANTAAASSPAAAAAASAPYDVAVCGGTLGIFVAAALALRGKRVVVVERGKLKGRSQEWNVSRRELSELVHLGVVTEREVEEVVAVEFNPCRCGFAGGKDIWVRDILNLGVSPSRLISLVQQRFLAAGGTVLEGVALKEIDVADDAAVLHFSSPSHPPISARLVVDAMGHGSPIVKQARGGRKPDGVCLVVGSCARGFPPAENTTGDIIYTNTPTTAIGRSPLQLFWEAFPAGSGPSDRTSYMFAYMDADRDRPALEEMLEMYWGEMQKYQNVRLEDLEFRRVLFGSFPTFRDSPLAPQFDRVIQVGDASGIQSPLSFGGFGAITRHLARITGGLVDALDADLLSKESLALINPYQPNLSGAWLLQRAMSARVGSSPPPDFINQLLACNFGCMERFGDPVLRPFLQDVTQFSPLALTMGSMMFAQPQLLPRILQQVGLVPLADWLVHFFGLGSFTALSLLATALKLSEWADSLPPKERFTWKRRLEAWQYGSGLDYQL